MRKFKKILGILTVLMLVLTVLPTNVFAAGSYTVSASQTTITVGKKASLTVTAKKCAGQFTATSSNPSVATVSGGPQWIDGSHSNASGKFTITAKSAGTATITITPTNVSDKEYNLITNTKTIKITVKKAATTTTTTDKNTTTKEPTKSSDATLKSLSTSVAKIDFNKSTTNYTVNVDKNVSSLGLKATVNNSKAKVSITGDEKFVTGNNTVKAVVTAEDGTTKTYTITVVKSKYGPAPVKSLKVKGYGISPEFEPEKLEYSMDAIDVNSVELEYELTFKDSTAKVEGANNLKPGKNEVKLVVIEKDGTITTYKVNVNVASSAVPVEKEDDNTVWLVLILILVILVIAETIYIVAKDNEEKKAKEKAKTTRTTRTTKKTATTKKVSAKATDKK